MDEKYFRPSKDQLEKIVPKIESATTTNADGYVSAELSNPRMDALEKRVAELERKIKEYDSAGKLNQKSP